MYCSYENRCSVPQSYSCGIFFYCRLHLFAMAVDAILGVLLFDSVVFFSSFSFLFRSTLLVHFFFAHWFRFILVYLTRVHFRSFVYYYYCWWWWSLLSLFFSSFTHSHYFSFVGVWIRFSCTLRFFLYSAHNLVHRDFGRWWRNTKDKIKQKKIENTENVQPTARCRLRKGMVTMEWGEKNNTPRRKTTIIRKKWCEP